MTLLCLRDMLLSLPAQIIQTCWIFDFELASFVVEFNVIKSILTLPDVGS